MMKPSHSILFQRLTEFIDDLDIKTLSPERKKILNPLIDLLQLKIKNGEKIRLNFICTHNSRRSHISQIWAQAMASHFNIENVYCYSGGTEATALFPMVVETLKKQGFQAQLLSKGINPVYAIKYAENESPVIGFSKKLDDDFNPKSDFVAIMTCDSANEACPFVPGAEKRIPITYEDPKAFDDTPKQEEKYLERSLQIATELKYVFSTLSR